MVRAIRLFKPLVVISRFTGTPADGHGQHQLAGYLTPLAFRAAADPKAFPEQFAEGLTPWKPLKLYVSQSFVANPQNEPSLYLNTGQYDPLLGRSYFEVAMEGRSQHKTQEMGTLELRGKQLSGLRLLESSVENSKDEKSVFDGIDISILGIAKIADDKSDALTAKLSELESIAKEALAQYRPTQPEALLPILFRGLKVSVEAENLAANPTSKFFCRQKTEDFKRAIVLASGVVIDALADDETLAPGEQTNIRLNVFAPDNVSVEFVNADINAPKGWQVRPTEEPKNDQQQQPFRPRAEAALVSKFFNVTVAADAKLTEPYWLEKDRNGFVFDWSNAGNAKNMPFADPILNAEVSLKINGEQVTISKEVENRYRDDIRGEIRREVNVVPPITLGTDSDLLIVPQSSNSQNYKVAVTAVNNSKQSLKGELSLSLPAGWKIKPEKTSLVLPKKGDAQTFEFEITPQTNARIGIYTIPIKAEVNGKTFGLKVKEIAYPHIQTHRRYLPAEIKAEVIDLKVEKVRVGYIMGSGDRVPEAIKRLGITPTLLSEKDLSTGDLSRFDVIVVGIRASQVRPDFVSNNARLLDWVRSGGTLIVQYQQQEYIRYGLAPFPAQMNGNSRVVDENAQITVLAPDNPIFNFPNRINDEDWKGWVQERNLYCFTDFDKANYVALLEAHDEGEKEQTGCMVFAKVGKGNYLYNAYSFFRQLPNGTPGAYRLFANILSLPKAR
jgi:hypothetical protein